ncbi:hypothetical protein [Streptomyces formicae]
MSVDDAMAGVGSPSAGRYGTVESGQVGTNDAKGGAMSSKRRRKKKARRKHAANHGSRPQS